MKHDARNERLAVRNAHRAARPESPFNPRNLPRHPFGYAIIPEDHTTAPPTL